MGSFSFILNKNWGRVRKTELKEQVLGALEQNKGGFISGNELAEKFFVSRNAVWKAVNVLRADGHEIDSVTNKGYCLKPDSDVLSKAGVEKYLGVSAGMYHIAVYKELDSTNALLKKLAASGAGEGTVAVTDCQTGGRGRFGRTFFSPAETGVYLSLLLRPKFKAEEATMITAAAAVAVAQAIESVTGTAAQIKWVNDVYCAGKKVCGILTEGAFDMESGGMEYAVLGIGVNVTAPEGGFPPELAQRAGAVFEGAAPPETRSRLIAEILRHFQPLYERLADRLFLDEYRARSFLVGQELDVIAGDTVRSARALAVDDDCHLVVRYEDGTVASLSSGEVSVRPQ